MIRFLSWLFNKPYEICKSCETLKEQLDYERAQSKEMLSLISSLLKPKEIFVPEQPPMPITPRHTIFSRRRAELEKTDAELARKMRNSTLVAREDPEQKSKVNPVEQLEIDLGIPVI